jgi:hypothetical protein
MTVHVHSLIDGPHNCHSEPEAPVPSVA